TDDQKSPLGGTLLSDKTEAKFTFASNSFTENTDTISIINTDDVQNKPATGFAERHSNPEQQSFSFLERELERRGSSSAEPALNKAEQKPAVPSEEFNNTNFEQELNNTEVPKPFTFNAEILAGISENLAQNSSNPNAGIAQEEESAALEECFRE